MTQPPTGGQQPPKDFEPPVGWLLGQQLLAGLKFIALYASYGEKLDARDWMRAKRIEHLEGDEFWFDYIADSGDGQKAVYNIAYLCQGDLWLPQAGSLPGAGIVSLERVDNGYPLPRGKFLLVGGDTAYHIADYETLAERFCKPLNWAYDDRRSAGETPSRTYIYGIPGNHDYYDALDGFNRQFLKPITEPTAARSFGTISYGPLELEGFDREQKASYVALDLPHDWKLWALDAQDGDLDKRQRAFFLETCKGVVPKKLIVATPEPVTKLGKYTEEEAPIVKAYTKLGLEPAFLERNKGRLAGDRCRLDISGDIHHYARYWGTGALSDSSPSENDRPNYASLVAGGGGAFLHASHSDVGDVPHAAIYPSRRDSHNLMLERLLNPYNIYRGGYVFVAGAIVAVSTYFAATIPDSSWSAFHWLTRIGNGQRPCGDPARCGADSEPLLERIQWALGIPGETAAQYTFPLLLDLLFATALLGVLIYLAFKTRKDSLMFRTRTDSDKLTQAELDEWHSTRVRWIQGDDGDGPRHPRILRRMVFILLWLAAPVVLSYVFPLTAIPPAFFASFMVFLFIGVLIAGLVFCRYVSDVLIALKKYLERQPDEKRDESPARPLQERPLWHRLEAYLGPYLEPYLPFALILASWFSVCYGVWRFGAYNASIMLTDVVTLLVLGLATLGLIALAFFVGGKLYKVRDLPFVEALAARKQFLLLGAWHAFVQVAVPFALIAYCDAWEIFGILAAIGVITAAARYYFRVEGEFTYTAQKDCGQKMWRAWIAVGLLLLLAALVMNWGEPAEVVTFWRIFGGAALIGALLSCVWLGWYLAISLAFNAHNNEAGGGANTENFRHLVRIKLTKDSLTGYVIGIDEPVASFDGNEKFKLVDVFTISCPSQRTP